MLAQILYLSHSHISIYDLIIILPGRTPHRHRHHRSAEE